MSPLPHRPRLAEHALVRRHVVDGVALVVIHDARTGDLMRMTPAAWDMIAGVDGTRDLDAIVLAAARRGALRRVSELRAILEQLHAAGLLADGLAHPVVVPEGALDRPLSVLPGFSLTCDGSGACCAMYGSIAFSPLEAARARALRPEVLDAGEHQERAFTPERGGQADGALAVALVDGGCPYVAGDGRCSLHVLGGAAAKPRGCRVYPATFVDDGESVRVSVAVECACVLASAGRAGGVPLVPAGARTRRDLEPGTPVGVLPEAVAPTPSTRAARAELVAWSRRVGAALPGVADPLSGAWSLADAVAAHGLDPDAAERALVAPAPPPERALGAHLEALAARARARVRAADAWRAQADRSRRASHVLAAAVDRLLAPAARLAALSTPSALRDDERFYLVAEVHGHALVGDLSIADALRDRAVRLLVARAVPEQGHPLALVESLMRGHGLAAYARAVSPPEAIASPDAG